MGVPFLLSSLWFLAPVGFALFFFALTRAECARHVLYVGWLGAYALYSFALYAIFWHTLPLEWLGVFEPRVAVLLVAVSWALTSAGFALGGAIFGLLVYYLTDGSWRDFFTISAAWVMSEVAGSFIFSIQNIGPGSFIGVDFTLPYLGYLLAENLALAQAAWLGGVYLLSALAACIGVLLVRACCADRKERVVLLVCLACFVVLSLCSWLVPSAAEADDMRLALVTTQEPPIFAPTLADTAENTKRIADLLSGVRDVDVVVLPESAGFVSGMRLLYGAEASGRIRDVFGDAVPIMIDSASGEHEGTQRSMLEVFDAATSRSVLSSKRFLLPDGEYVPYLYRPLIALLGGEDTLRAITEHREFTPGPVPAPFEIASAPVGILFCNEALSPVLYQTLARDGAEAFVNLSSHAWFHGSRAVYEHMQRVARVRAIESRRFYLQANNTAPSFALDPYGRLLAESAWNSEEVLLVDAEAQIEATPYSAAGKGVLCFPLILLAAAAARMKRVY